MKYHVILPLVGNYWSATFRHHHFPHLLHFGIRWHHVVIRQLVLVTNSYNEHENTHTV